MSVILIILMRLLHGMRSKNKKMMSMQIGVMKNQHRDQQNHQRHQDRLYGIHQRLQNQQIRQRLHVQQKFKLSIQRVHQRLQNQRNRQKLHVQQNGNHQRHRDQQNHILRDQLDQKRHQNQQRKIEHQSQQNQKKLHDQQNGIHQKHLDQQREKRPTPDRTPRPTYGEEDKT